MAQTKRRIIRKSKPPRRSGDVPATARMIHEARHELKSEITSFRLGVDSRFKSVDARFNGVDAQFDRVDARFNEVDARFNEVDARFDRVDARFNEMDARFSEMDGRFNKVDARLDDLGSKVESVLAAVHRVGLLVEEQNARNKYVLDGYTFLSDRLDRVEKKVGVDL